MSNNLNCLQKKYEHFGIDFHDKTQVPLTHYPKHLIFLPHLKY